MNVHVNGSSVIAVQLNKCTFSAFQVSTAIRVHYGFLCLPRLVEMTESTAVSWENLCSDKERYEL
jgi:hypothetical protein